MWHRVPISFGFLLCISAHLLVVILMNHLPIYFHCHVIIKQALLKNHHCLISKNLAHFIKFNSFWLIFLSSFSKNFFTLGCFKNICRFNVRFFFSTSFFPGVSQIYCYFGYCFFLYLKNQLKKEKLDRQSAPTTISINLIWYSLFQINYYYY